MFLYCYFADEVAHESVNVIDAVMEEMDWPGAPITVQKSMIIVMCRALKPVHITAGKFVPISMEVFMNVSYFWFLFLHKFKMWHKLSFTDRKNLLLLFYGVKATQF